ncbi:MAG: glucose-1-phosphate thymidylyltransferase [Bacteroidales bacterium]|jgi:UDP-N-acetylglucosamine diphosphorylase/glucosamine-1-phosphate N-acetyltransferase|nr:glucose-1-phosphate thymidylyltransferase [Bacteroidales bacterium]
MNYILFDDFSRGNLLPLTFTRPVADLLAGILTLRQKWELLLGAPTSTLTEEYLSEKFPLIKGEDNMLINGSIVPNEALVEAIKNLEPNHALLSNDIIVALHVESANLEKVEEGDTEGIEETETHVDFIKINYPWDLFSFNDKYIADDFNLITRYRKSAPIPASNRVINPDNIFIEEGAVVENCSLNASAGPIYIGRNAEIWEGASLRGPVAVLDGAIVKMNAIVYGATTIGRHAKVGGEIENSILFGYSNKPHAGYLGHSVIGEWCNIAAGTNVANLNNTYKPVKMWNYPQARFIDTGLQFCGLVMGDHSKTGINTSFNTGSVVGVSSNVFGYGYQRNFVASFMWGGPHAGYQGYDLEKALDTAAEMYTRRNLQLSDKDQKILEAIYEITKDNRRL